MKIPLDIICVRSGVLCPRCRRLVDSGIYTQREVEIMRYLLELEEQDTSFRFLKDATYVKSYETNSMILTVLEVSSDVPQSALAKLGRTLGAKMNTKVRVIRKSDPKNMIVQVVAPARVQGVNSVWTPDGDVQHIIRISRYDARLLPAEVNELELLLSMILNENYKIKVQ
jgi:transcription antitermination factor NusA-like protein|uniref:Transcription elongation factor NusA n=1 Tax=Ignisphaera aggregans TaxID=334771 RepID=A0A7J2U339_9CREN